MTHSFVHSRAQVETLERAARQLLALPALPDGATGPRSRALLAQIQADRAALGEAEALRRWARYSSVAYACSLDDDPAEHRAASGRGVEHLAHPTRPGEYAFPDCARLRAALADPQARGRCSAAVLSSLDAHAANTHELPPDWTPAVKLSR